MAYETALEIHYFEKCSSTFLVADKGFIQRAKTLKAYDSDIRWSCHLILKCTNQYLRSSFYVIPKLLIHFINTSPHQELSDNIGYSFLQGNLGYL